MTIFVRKLNNTSEPYDENKIIASLQKSGASEKTIQTILEDVNNILYNEIETRKLFKFIHKKLVKYEASVSHKYSIKNALFRLGEEGFAFEKFVAKLLHKKGYDVELNRFVKGKIISHEIDVTAKRDKETLMVECKYHKKPWTISDIKVALYVYARFLDLKEKFSKPMIVTNTRFSPTVIQYARGVKMALMGWKYPEGDSLEMNLEKYKVYPVTMLTKLNSKMMNTCFKEGIVTVDDVIHTSAEDLMKCLIIKRSKIDEIKEEAKILKSI